MFFLQVKKVKNKEKKSNHLCIVKTVFMYTALKKFWQLDESASKMDAVFPCFFFQLGIRVKPIANKPIPRSSFRANSYYL